MIEIEELLNSTECEYIEFKEYWYWTHKEEKKGQIKNLDELLKDLSALLNTKTNDKKYLIIGKADKNNNLHNYFLDKNNEYLNYFKKDFNEIKQDLVKKILNNFDIDYLELEKLDTEERIKCFEKKEIIQFLEESIYIREEEIKNIKILVFEFNNIPFMLKSKRDIKTIYEGTIPIRGISKNGEVSVIKFSYDLEKTYRNKLKEVYFEQVYLRPNKSIENIVKIYKETFYPFHEIKYEKPDVSFSKNNFYEIFFLEKDGKCLETIIYLSKYSGKGKVLNFLFKKFKKQLSLGFYVIFQEETKINKIKIEEEFLPLKEKGKFLSLENFIQTNIYQTIRKQIEDGLSQKNSYKKIFINPLIKETEDGIKYMKKWLLNSKSPILALIGSGGVGKTTLAKKFMSEVDNRDVIFIDSSNLISSYNLNNIASFLNEYFKKEIKRSMPFEENLLKILLDSGNLLVIIDGIDEIIMKSSLFNFKNFLKNIYKERNADLAKTKIIFTIRNNIFNDWESLLGCEKLTLLGFDQKKVENYIDQKGLSSKKNKIFNLLYKTFPNEKTYSPFIVEMLVHEFQSQNKHNYANKENEINSKYLCSNINLDKLIFFILDRESLKSEIFTVDEQIELIINIIKNFGIEITNQQLQEIIKEDKKINFLKQHPLFNYEEKEGKFYLKYDFLENYFLFIDFIFNLSNYNKVEDFDYCNNKKYLKKVKKIFIENDHLLITRSKNFNIDGDIVGSILKEILDYEPVKKQLDKFLLKQNNDDKLDNDLLDLISLLFHIALLLKYSALKDINDYTNFMKDIFEKKDEKKSKIEYLVLNKKINKKYKFDFKNTKIIKSYINYEYFIESTFNEKTSFSKCILERFCNSKNNKKFSFSKLQFQDCYTSTIINNHLSLCANEFNQEYNNLKNKIMKIIRKFYISGTFQNINKEKLKGIDTEIFEFLLKEEIIKETFKTTKEKRRDQKYIINKYQKEFERILEKQQRNIEILDNLINKYIENKK